MLLHSLAIDTIDLVTGIVSMAKLSLSIQSLGCRENYKTLGAGRTKATAHKMKAFTQN